MSKIYSEILSAELARVDKEYSDPYVYSAAMDEYISNKMQVVSQTLQDISYISTLLDSSGKPYDILAIMDVNHYGLQNGATLPSGAHAEVDTYTAAEREELGEDYFSLESLPSDANTLLSNLSNRVLVGDNCLISGSDLIRSLVKQRDGLYNGGEAIINTMNGLKISGNDMMASIATQIAEFKIFSSGFKAVVQSKTSSLSEAFTNNINLISDKFKDKSLSSIFYSLFNNAKGSASQAVSSMVTLLKDSLKSAIDSVGSDGSITTIYTLGEYSGLTFSSALGLADMSSIGNLLQNVVLIVGAAGYCVYNLISKGFAMLGSAINKFVRKYAVLNQMEYNDGGENGYLDFPIISSRYNISDGSLLEAYGDTPIMGSYYTVDSFFHHLTNNPEFPDEYATSFIDIYNSLGDESNHWMVDLKFALMFLSRSGGALQMDIYLKPLVPDLEGGFNISTDDDCGSFEKRNFVAQYADGTPIEISQSLFWRAPSLSPSRSMGYLNYEGSVTNGMKVSCGFVFDGIAATTVGPSTQTTFQTPSGYYPRSVVNRIRSIFPIDGAKYWVFDPKALLEYWQWNVTDRDEARVARIYNTHYAYLYSSWTEIALLAYLWLRVNAYIPDWDCEVLTQQVDYIQLAHADIDHGLFSYQVLGTGTNAQAHIWTVGAYDVPEGSPAITYSSAISANVPYATVDNTNYHYPITNLSKLASQNAWFSESPLTYWDPNDPSKATWDVPNNFLITRLIITPGTIVYNSISDVGSSNTSEKAIFTFNLSFFVGIWCQILLNKKENMSRVYESWNDFPLFIPYNTVQQLPSAQYHILTSSELDKRAKVLPTIAVGAAIAVVAIAAAVTTVFVIKKKLRNSMEMISVSAEAAKYAFEDDIKSFNRGEMSLEDFTRKKKDYLRITKRNKLKAKIYTALGAESISSNYFDLCADDDQGTDSINSSSLSESIFNTDGNVDNVIALIAGA